MTKPIPDKAEVAVEYPDKLYIGTFERRRVSMLISMKRASRCFADILRDLAKK